MAFGILPVGMAMCAWAVEHVEVTFLNLCVTVQWQERPALCA